MNEIDPTLEYSVFVLVAQMMMHYVSLKNYYFAQSVTHQHTPNKTDHVLLTFVVWSVVCFWVSTIPAAILATAMVFCAESPHWLYKVDT